MNECILARLSWRTHLIVIQAVSAAGLPYGRGFRRRLALAVESEDARTAMRALLSEKLSDAEKLEGIPARAQAAILRWFLG